jgi:hypothetical protein
MAATVRQYIANGNKVPVPVGHANWENPERNRGWLVDACVEGDSLIGTVELVGDGAKLAGTSDVSIYAEPSFTDSRGNYYEWPIRHVALCVDPVVPGLSGFMPLAASQGAAVTDVPILKPAPGSPTDYQVAQERKATADAAKADANRSRREAMLEAVTAALQRGSFSKAMRDGVLRAAQIRLRPQENDRDLNEIESNIREVIRSAIGEGVTASMDQWTAIARNLFQACAQALGFTVGGDVEGRAVGLGALATSLQEWHDASAKQQRAEMLAETKRLAGMKEDPTTPIAASQSAGAGMTLEEKMMADTKRFAGLK